MLLKQLQSLPYVGSTVTEENIRGEHVMITGLIPYRGGETLVHVHIRQGVAYVICGPMHSTCSLEDLPLELESLRAALDETHRVHETLTLEFSGAMWVCSECGGKLTPQGGVGRVFTIRKGFQFVLPGDFAIPTCEECGESFVHEALALRIREMAGAK